ncbi:MAG: OmpH family outer membrane protein [Bacteroidota bacterium]
MKQGFKYLLIALLIVGSLSAVQAQKFGYLNSALVLAEMPETKAADDKMAAFQKQLETEAQAKAEDLQAKISKYIQEAQSGVLTPVEMQEKEAALTKEQEAFGTYEQGLYAKVQSKREELYEPILQKVQDAIDAVGKENGYQFIFDISVMNVVVYADEAEDVIDLVKAKL